MYGRLSRGEFVKLAYRLGLGAATGELELAEDGGARHRVYLRRGYLTAARVEGHWAPLGELLRDAGQIDNEQLRRSLEAVATGATFQGRALVEQGALTEAALDRALRRQAELRLERLAAIPSATYRLDAHAKPPPPCLGGRPLALVAWARRHLEARLDAARAREFAGELYGARLSLRKHVLPPASFLDDTDRRILEAMAAPRRLDELELAARAPRLRLLAFLYFLRAVGAVELLGVAADRSARPTGAPPPPRFATSHVSGPARGPVAGSAPPDPLAAARRVLGVGPDADAAAIRRAYRRLARALHPDRHPAATDDLRRALESRFSELTQAYRALTRSSL